MKTGRIVGVVAASTLVAAAFTGAAIAFAADDTTGSAQQAPGQQAQGQQGHEADGRGDRGPGHMGPEGMGPEGMGPGRDGDRMRGEMVHGESVVETEDGTFITVRMQEGTVTAVSDTSLTVKSDDGFTGTYVLNDATHLVRNGADATAPKVGDEVHVRATVSGTTATADDVMALSAEKAAELEQHRADMEQWMSQRPADPQRPQPQPSSAS